MLIYQQMKNPGMLEQSVTTMSANQTYSNKAVKIKNVQQGGLFLNGNAVYNHHHRGVLTDRCAPP